MMTEQLITRLEIPFTSRTQPYGLWVVSSHGNIQPGLHPGSFNSQDSSGTTCHTMAITSRCSHNGVLQKRQRKGCG